MDDEEDDGVVEGGRGEGGLDEDDDDGCRGDVDGQRLFHLIFDGRNMTGGPGRC